MGDIPSDEPDTHGVEPTPAKTHLAFHYDAKLLKHKTTLVSVRRFSELEDANKQLLLKLAGQDQGSALVIVTSETIFHPQGGGQPSDEGAMRINDHSFAITAVRMDAVHSAQVLHLGRLANPNPNPNPSDDDDPATASTTAAEIASSLRPGVQVEQSVDADKRLLYSRLHTAGHVLGSAVRNLLENEVPGFDELKASHFPDSAACEFQGLIDGKWRPQIQAHVDEYVRRAMPVQIEFWTEDDFRREGLERLIPDRGLLAPGESRFRVVRIVGAEVYPCGGTHVDTTDLCGETTVKKISRSKGVSRVSYTVAS